MRIAVKICGFTRPSDMAWAAEAGVDAVGVVFDRGPRKVSKASARRLVDAVRGAALERVAVVGEADPETWPEYAELGFDVVQAVVSPSWVQPLPPVPTVAVFFDGQNLVERVQAWRRARAEDVEATPRPGSISGLINVDGAGGGGQGVPADWTRARAVAAREPLMLSGGLSSKNLEAALRAVRPHAVDVCSSVERTPGVLDRGLAGAFVREVRRMESVLRAAA